MATTLPDQPLSPANPGIDEKVSMNTGTQTAFIHEEPGYTASPSIDAEMLLRALRNVITPLVHPADGEYKNDANQSVLGRGGREFVTALEKFMSSFLRGPVGGIKVELEEKGVVIPNPGSQPTSNDDLNPEDVAAVAPHTEQLPDSFAPAQNKSQEDLRSMHVHTEESPDRSVVSIGDSPSIADTVTFEQQKSRFIEKVLNALHERVFNTMPIRMLCFKPHGSKLQITLVERGEINAQIATDLKNSIDFLEVSRKINEYERNNIVSSKEAEEYVIWELIRKYSGYAILSHTWLRGVSGEVTYDDWTRRQFGAQEPGYRKLVNFCTTAWKDYRVSLGWMDTICINKDSSAELDESIRSMFKWYKNAQVCITYLAETVSLSDMHNDTWFTRGWTLQELLAPSRIKFYNTHWNKLVEFNDNDKKHSVILKQVEEATTITAEELQNRIYWIPISRRMQMAANRQVTREEDSAYSLIGIFNVSMATAYGEGAERAFSRLLQEVLGSSLYDITDIFNWAGSTDSQSHSSSLLPSSLQGYLHRSSSLSSNSIFSKPVEPIMVTHLGLRITILLMRAISMEDPTESPWKPFGDYYGIADISAHPEYDQYLDDDDETAIARGSYSVLDTRISDRNGWNEEKTWCQLTLGVLNTGGSFGDGTMILLPPYCLAVALSTSTILPIVPTATPITFAFSKIGRSNEGIPGYFIRRSELKSHGMKLVTKVL